MWNRPVPSVFAQNRPLDCPLAESPANSTAACVTGALIARRSVSVEPGMDAATRAGPHEVPESAVKPGPLVSATRAGVTFVSRTGTRGTGPPSKSTDTVGVTDSLSFSEVLRAEGHAAPRAQLTGANVDHRHSHGRDRDPSRDRDRVDPRIQHRPVRRADPLERHF